MFTGLVRSLGTAQLISSSQIRVICPELQPQLAYGDSVAVDGLCLTVVEILPDGFLADVSPETLRRSVWGQGSGPRTVNLEPSLRVGDKLGGHFVSGHIDGVGQLWEQAATGNAWELSFKVPAEIGRYIVPKGSVAVNGVSLTVAEVRQGGLLVQGGGDPADLPRDQPLLAAGGGSGERGGGHAGQVCGKIVGPGSAGERPFSGVSGRARICLSP